MNNYSHIGLLIIPELEKQKLTQSDLAKEFNITQARISQWMHHELPDQYILKLSTILGIPIDWICDAVADDYRDKLKRQNSKLIKKELNKMEQPAQDLRF